MTDDGSIITAGVAELEGRDEVIGFECFAVRTGYREQIGNRRGAPWRNPKTGIIRMGTFWSDDHAACMARAEGVNISLSMIQGVQAALAMLAEDAARRERGRGVIRRNPNDINLTPPK